MTDNNKSYNRKSIKPAKKARPRVYEAGTGLHQKPYFTLIVFVVSWITKLSLPASPGAGSS